MPYYKVIDDKLSEQIAELLRERNESLNEMHDFADIVGGELGTSEHPGGIEAGFKFDKPDEKLWKRATRDSEWWVPRCSSKEGKRLHAELLKLRSKSVSHYDFGRLFGLPWHEAPGIKSLPAGKGSKHRVFFVELPTVPKPNLRKKLKRISDIEWDNIYG